MHRLEHLLRHTARVERRNGNVRKILGEYAELPSPFGRCAENFENGSAAEKRQGEEVTVFPI